MPKLQLTKGRLTLWITAAVFGVYVSHIGFRIKGHDVKSDYNDYKIFLKYFDQSFEDLGEVPWNLIEKDCNQYHLKKHKSLLILDFHEKDGAIFTDKSLPTSRFLMTTLERYTRYASEGLSPTVDEAFAPEKLMKELYELSNETEVITEWKNYSENNKCYHLLEKISEAPSKSDAYKPRTIKQNLGP